MVVARTKNFTRAAEELNLSQPALSRSIQKLEEGLGLRLFERKPREVVLTDVGELMLERAKDILKLVEDTISELSDEGSQGRVRIGAIPTIAPYFLPDVLSSFHEEYPNISVTVREDVTETLMKCCSHGEIDFAILALPVFAKYLECEELFEEELLLVTPRDHELLDKTKITAKSVEKYPFILLNEAHCLSGNVEAFCRKEHIQPITVERISQLATVQELVALNHGISIIPETASRLDESDRRTYRSFDSDKPTRVLAMVWNPYRYQSKWVKTMRDHLRRHYQH